MLSLFRSRANGHPAIPSGIEPVEAAAHPKPAAVLSPSQVSAWLTCPAKWYFKYLVGRPDRPTGALSLGSSVHAGINVSFTQKLNSRKDLAPGEAVGAFWLDWRQRMPETEFRDDEKHEELGALGAALVEHYMIAAAPKIQPAAVELAVEGGIAGVEVRGIIDILTEEGQIIDLKTAAKKPAGLSADHRLQLTTYDLLCPRSRGQARLDTLVKSATIELVQQSTTIGPADVQLAESIYPAVQQAMRDGIYYPRRANNYLCSRKHCPFWRSCEKEFGGEVGS